MRRYSGNALVAILVIGLLVGAGGMYALTGSIHGTNATMTITLTSSSTSTTTVTVIPTQQVVDAYDSHIQSIESGNLTSIVAGFEDNATVQLLDNLIGQATLGRPGNSSVEFGIFQDWFHTVTVANQTYYVSFPGSSERASVNSTFNMYGSTDITAPPTLAYVMSVELYVSFAFVGGHWLISDEVWQFLIWRACPTLQSPNCGTLLSQSPVA
jgi:hypothetical protein